MHTALCTILKSFGNALRKHIALLLLQHVRDFKYTFKLLYVIRIFSTTTFIITILQVGEPLLKQKLQKISH